MKGELLQFPPIHDGPDDESDEIKGMRQIAADVRRLVGQQEFEKAKAEAEKMKVPDDRKDPDAFVMRGMYDAAKRYIQGIEGNSQRDEE